MAHYGVRKAIIRRGCFAGVEKTDIASSSNAIDAGESARRISLLAPQGAVYGVIGPPSKQSGGRPMLAWYRNGERI